MERDPAAELRRSAPAPAASRRSDRPAAARPCRHRSRQSRRCASRDPLPRPASGRPNRRGPAPAPRARSARRRQRRRTCRRAGHTAGCRAWARAYGVAAAARNGFRWAAAPGDERSRRRAGRLQALWYASPMSTPNSRFPTLDARLSRRTWRPGSSKLGVGCWLALCLFPAASPASPGRYAIHEFAKHVFEFKAFATAPWWRRRSPSGRRPDGRHRGQCAGPPVSIGWRDEPMVVLGEDPAMELVPVERDGGTSTPAQTALREARLGSRVRR